MEFKVPKLYYCADGETVIGPLLPIEIERQIRRGTLPANVLVCEEGHQVWSEFLAWQKAKTSAMLFGCSPWALTILCVIATIIVIFLTMIAVVAILSSIK